MGFSIFHRPSGHFIRREYEQEEVTEALARESSVAEETKGRASHQLSRDDRRSPEGEHQDGRQGEEVSTADTIRKAGCVGVAAFADPIDRRLSFHYFIPLRGLRGIRIFTLPDETFVLDNTISEEHEVPKATRFGVMRQIIKWFRRELRIRHAEKVRLGEAS